jgi:uncharacterized membrane protein
MSNKNQIQRQEVSVSYEGPLPTSREFAGYEQVLPGAADRILTITEKEAEHRRANQDKLVNASIKYSGRGQIFCNCQFSPLLGRGVPREESSPIIRGNGIGNTFKQRFEIV